ncbi:hypothetical protein ABH37_03440 [Mycobacterium haemophilum]|uniref:Uncharacterized protein n=1 Tax=Mycobacterium haemophilum TaxID=29311 RepID=A0A0I9TRM5_9MYCO|nr:hypothetical protein ABH39_06970 [Mycobacterium haemophilum]KLO38630.1 hypothetical protein ABH38_04545 [Mycobacterium haemophilum]KLO44964.1 hypothetical protein ABH37_03440 [Mycobacterium haemophilum]KLO56308.1 hypothetical protein ABH36_03420 [Mycobacterium haemophilum]
MTLCAYPALIPTHAWRAHSAGAHGPRLYSWVWFRLLAEDDTDIGVHHLLIRLLIGRNDTTGEHAALRCYSPRPVPQRDRGHCHRTRYRTHTDRADRVDRQ